MCLRWRSRSSITRTAGITPAIKAETTTTTTKPRRRCFLCGTPVTQPCVTTSRPAGEIWAEKAKSQDLFEVRQTSRNIKEPTSCLLHRCHHQYVYGPSRTYGHIPPLSALPGHDYDQPLLPGNPESMQFSEPPPQYFGPPQSSCQSVSEGVKLVCQMSDTHICTRRRGKMQKVCCAPAQERNVLSDTHMGVSERHTLTNARMHSHNS